MKYRVKHTKEKEYLFNLTSITVNSDYYAKTVDIQDVEALDIFISFLIYRDYEFLEQQAFFHNTSYDYLKVSAEHALNLLPENVRNTLNSLESARYLHRYIIGDSLKITALFDVEEILDIIELEKLEED